MFFHVVFAKRFQRGSYFEKLTTFLFLRRNNQFLPVKSGDSGNREIREKIGLSGFYRDVVKLSLK